MRFGQCYVRGFHVGSLDYCFQKIVLINDHSVGKELVAGAQANCKAAESGEQCAHYARADGEVN